MTASSGTLGRINWAEVHQLLVTHMIQGSLFCLMYGQRPSWRASFEAVRVSKNERPVDGVLVPFISVY